MVLFLFLFFLSAQTCRETEDPGAIQKAADFIQALCLGFEVDDAVALLRMDDLFIDSFEIKDGMSRSFSFLEYPRFISFAYTRV